MKTRSAQVKLLIVNTSLRTGPLWAYSLQSEKFDVVLESEPAKMLRRWEEERPDLVVLDSSKEDVSMLTMIHTLRGESTVPILLVTSAKSDEYVLRAYEAGADECIVKPISPSVFHAKIRAWVRRSLSVPLDMLEPVRVGGVQVKPADSSVQINHTGPIHLTNLELRVLHALMSRPSRAIPDEELLRLVWGYEGEMDKAALKNVIYRLRSKIETDRRVPRLIQTIPGVGYRFSAER